jgi:hypothetical protein
MTDHAAEVLETLRNLVKFDLRTLFDGNNSLLPPALWPQEAALAITSITSREIWSGTGQDRTLVGIEHKLRLSDRIKAVELALKEAGVLSPDRVPPEELEPDDMSDAQIMQRLRELYRVDNRKSRWATATDAEIDSDFAEICEAYDERRPGVRSNATETTPAAVQRYLPAPPRCHLGLWEDPHRRRPHRLRKRLGKRFCRMIRRNRSFNSRSIRDSSVAASISMRWVCISGGGDDAAPGPFGEASALAVVLRCRDGGIHLDRQSEPHCLCGLHRGADASCSS